MMGRMGAVLASELEHALGLEPKPTGPKLELVP
jgi:hypothetical protein